MSNALRDVRDLLVLEIQIAKADVVFAKHAVIGCERRVDELRKRLAAIESELRERGE